MEPKTIIKMVSIGVFLRSKELIFLIKNVLWLYAELRLPLERGAHFHKFHEKKLSDDEKWSRKTLDGMYDGYLWGLSGAEKRKC